MATELTASELPMGALLVTPPVTPPRIGTGNIDVGGIGLSLNVLMSFVKVGIALRYSI